VSIKLMTAAWDIPLPHADKLLLLALADQANDEGCCWPKVSTLATKCGLEDRTAGSSRAWRWPVTSRCSSAPCRRRTAGC
jgi:hypothetical protein